MYILTVAPIARGVLHGNLTYFAKERPFVGSVIMVPIRTREVPALVLEITEVADSKSSIKSSDYAIRKIAHVTPKRLWSEAFLKAAEKTAHFGAQGFGETLLTLTPKPILDAYLEGTLAEPPHSKEASPRTRILATQASTKTRIEEYQRLIRESFTEQKSVFICLPSELDVERVYTELKRGIEEYAYSFTSSLSAKKLLPLWERVVHEEHAILVVGTTQYLSLPRRFSTIIIDEEHARTWKTLVRPFIDLRVFIETFAKESGSTVIYGAPILRPEIHKRLREGDIQEFGRIFSRAHLEAIGNHLASEIVDPRIEEKDIKEHTGVRTFQILSEKIRSGITAAREAKESTLLITARKGISPITRCGDCGTVISCKECETPLVIHTRADGSRIFSCHACGFMRIPEDDMHETCPTCGGWRLEALGIGIERVVQEIKDQFPGTSVLVFDGDHIKTPAQAKKLIAQLEQQKKEGLAPILVGTPMVVPYLHGIDNTAIISIDSLFAIPDFRMGERIFAMILALREKTKNRLLVQTRTDDRTLLEAAVSGNLTGFTDQELVLRKAFSYPPYGTIIKITLRGKKESISEELDRLKNFLNDYTLIIPPTMARDIKGLYRMHALIKLPEGAWNSVSTTALAQKLTTLPHQFTVEVNPDHLL